MFLSVSEMLLILVLVSASGILLLLMEMQSKLIEQTREEERNNAGMGNFTHSISTNQTS